MSDQILLTGKELKEMSMEELMGLKSTEIKEAVGFQPFPHCIVNLKIGNPSFEENNGKIRMEIPYVVTEILEILSKDPETGNAVEFELTEDNCERKEYLYPASAGLQWFVATWKEVIGEVTVGEYPEALAGLELVAEISARRDKKEPDRINNSIASIQIGG